MRAVSAVAVAVAVLVAFAGAADATATCDFTAAVGKCASSGRQTRCGQWRCLAKECPTEITMSKAIEVCASPAKNEPLYPNDVAAEGNARKYNSDGDDTYARPASSSVSIKKTPLLGTPRVESSCLNVSANWNVENIRAMLYSFSMDVYAGRYHETYSENMTLRWVGIHDHICAPNVPRYSDCSSTVTWLYWNLFGNGVDFMNGENWGAGYTGTLKEHGVDAGTNPADLKVGDLCFYYHPMHHVAIYVGDNKVVSHGMDPVGYYAYNYAPLDFCRRYLD
uniref:NlpC/P60 domain-containing protein n=1 Tax=Neobodo designis TaxID=312471 RepID=A0A7S1LGF4_NEODS|eukprot:CAMPEP_0174849720 /NCGR_PEP_ID=MMETSP1114-20130205/16942_1 /TAXON_ID=312471 /ORGANISM="Neobodo designis, Strain CCAP 1951/1" /LENGTH=278 /DNA_ID=CAMNT_0016084109 /DNA_START=41 /DNA_END=877 /DNA_ORIENTATION=+